MVPGYVKQSIILSVPESVSKKWQSLQDMSPTSIPDAGPLACESPNLEVVIDCLAYFSLCPRPGGDKLIGAGSELTMQFQKGCLM